MKQVSTLFDALRNEKFAVAVKDDNGTRYYGVDGAGIEWAQWANAVDTKSLESSQLPAGVIQGPFKNTTDIALKSLINSLGYSQPQNGVISDSKAYAYKSSYHVPNGARVPAVMDTPISHFTTTQYTSAVNYKALAVRTQIKEGSFLFEARANNYAFNFEKSMYNSMPSKAEIKTLRQRIDNNLGRSTERRLGLKLKNAIIETGERKNIGVIYGLETKSLGESLEQKGIGQRIGGAARLARRAGNFDPKAWDGDGDGLVQEGTPYQRPAVPGVNDRSTGGRVDARAAIREYGKATRQRIASKPTDEVSADSKPSQQSRPSASKIPSSGMRSRVSTARTQRQVEGLASASSRSKKKAIARAIPGRDKVSEKDGEIWDSLTDEQRDLAETQAQQAYKDLMDEIKTLDSDWWNSFLEQNATVKKKQKIDVDGNEWNKDSRIAGEAFTSYQLAVEDAIDRMKVQLSGLESQIANTLLLDPDEKRKLENKAKRLSKQIDRAQQIIDDLLTFDQMYKNDDWSLLEHLHPENRQKILGTKVPKAQQSNYKKVFGDTKPPMKLGEPSTIFEKEIISDKPRLGERTDTRLADFARRITRPNPIRAEKRRLRKEGKGKTRGQEDARDKVSRVKRRIAKAKRDIKKTIRGKRDQEQVQNDVAKAMKNNRVLIKRDKDGNPIVDQSTIDRFSKLLVGYKPSEKKKKEQSGKGKNADSFLGQIWDSQGFSALPTAVTKEEAKELIAQGWIPIQRGHGGSNKNQASQFAEEYIFDPLRYITGEGGEAVGPGEYWGHPENRGWDSWINPQSSDLGTIAMIPPTARIISASDAQRIKRDGDTIAEAVKGYLSGAGSGGKAESLDPADLVRELKEHLSRALPSDSSVWSTEVGKVYSQIFSLMEAGDTAEAKQLFNALKFMSKQRDSHQNIYAMILGYDGIDYGKSDGRLLMFNRASLAIMDNPIPLDEIKKMGAGL
jgi:hypothetical protein